MAVKDFLTLTGCGGIAPNLSLPGKDSVACISCS